MVRRGFASAMKFPRRLRAALQRIELEPGDEISAAETVLAVIEPGDPSLLDARAQALAEARVKAAEAALAQSLEGLTQADEDNSLAAKEFKRVRALFEKEFASQKELDMAESGARKAEAGLRAATLAQKIAEFELEQSRAALIHSTPGSAAAQRFQIPAPIDGKVLHLFQESSAVVPVGSKLLEVGNPTDLEVEIDVLSTDAVRISPGQRVVLEHWGGPHALEARVRLVEPGAFTKVSALGVEEQRVFVIADLIDPPERRPTLGDAYRVEARVVVWEEDDVLRVPAGALFREGENWAVFERVDGYAKLREVKLGENNGLEAEVLEGLDAGAEVVLHPTDQIEIDVLIEPR